MHTRIQTSNTADMKKSTDSNFTYHIRNEDMLPKHDSMLPKHDIKFLERMYRTEKSAQRTLRLQDT